MYPERSSRNDYASVAFEAERRNAAFDPTFSFCQSAGWYQSLPSSRSSFFIARAEN